MDILRIAALGTAGVLLGITVKGAKPEFALLVTVGAGLCIPVSYIHLRAHETDSYLVFLLLLEKKQPIMYC